MKSIALAVVLLLVLAQAGNAATPQPATFTYQGSLSANGQPANGNFDLAFKLFDAATGGTQVGSTITMTQFPVVNGKFTTDLTFPPDAFNGSQRWIDVTVGTQTLSPRQPVNTVPVAQYALAVPPTSPPPVFMSGTANAVLTTDTLGRPSQVAVLPLSGYTGAAYAYTLDPGPIMISLNPTTNPPPPAPQLFASNGRIGSMRGILTLTNSDARVYIGTTIAVTAQVYTSSSAQIPGNELTPLPGASCSFDTSAMQNLFFAGLYTRCLQTGLAANYIAGDQAVLVVSATATAVGNGPLQVSLSMNISVSAGQ